jgi:hypothetical protein
VPFDQSSSDADFGRPVVQPEVESLERDRLADPKSATGEQFEQQLVALGGHR